MIRTDLPVNECDICGHLWLSLTTPKRCSKCKSMKWNTSRVPIEHLSTVPLVQQLAVSVPTVQSRLEVARKAIASVVEDSVFDEPVRVVHDPMECQDRGCRECKKLRQQRRPSRKWTG